MQQALHILPELHKMAEGDVLDLSTYSRWFQCLHVSTMMFPIEILPGQPFIKHSLRGGSSHESLVVRCGFHKPGGLICPIPPINRKIVYKLVITCYTPSIHENSCSTLTRQASKGHAALSNPSPSWPHLCLQLEAGGPSSDG